MEIIRFSANAHKCNITHRVDQCRTLLINSFVSILIIFLLLSFLPVKLAYLHVCFWLVVWMKTNKCTSPRGPTHIFTNGGGGVEEILGSEILAKRDFLGSMKNAGIFLAREKENTKILGGIVLFISSNQ